MPLFFGDCADLVREGQRLREVAKAKFFFEVMFFDDLPAAAEVAMEREELLAFQRRHPAATRNALFAGEDEWRELLGGHAMPKCFFTVDVDHRHIVREATLQIGIAIDVDFVGHQAGGANRMFRVLAQRTIAACVECDFHSIDSTAVADNLDLNGKVALVTGASRGIGRETAIRLASAGALVGVNYHRSKDEALSVVREIGDAKAVALHADVADPAQTSSMIDALIERFGKIDILVNNAATFDMNPFDRDDYAAWQQGWRRTFDLNVFGAANAAFLAMRSMRKNGGGKIINVASRAAFRGEIEFADYGASKAALVNLTRSIARGCAKDNIIASCVAPGFIETEMARSELEAHREEIERQIPLGRVGRVGDVAAVILFLASPMADYLNGVTIDINGGSWFH